MDDTNRPGVIRFLIYLIAAAGLAGGLAGWVQSTGGVDWASELEAPNWTLGTDFSVLIGVLMIPPIAIALWLCQRSGRDGMRLLCSLLIAGALAVIIGHMLFFFGARDVALGFVAQLASWVYILFVTGIVGRCSRAAGYLFWPVFAWNTFNLTVSFELMRLNVGVIGGL